MPGRRCRYYLNTSFFADLEAGRPEALAFARRRRGLCTSSVLLYEYRAAGRASVAKALARTYGVRVYKVPVRRLRERAILLLAEWGVTKPSDNTILDVAHILAAKAVGATYMVSADASTCKRAIRLGLYCINHRTGAEHAPP